MVGPKIVARVEQPDELASREVKTSDIRSFESVPMRASKRKVSFDCLSAMLFSEDMVNLKRQGKSELGNQAVFATPRRGSVSSGGAPWSHLADAARFTQEPPSPRLHDRQQTPDVQIAL